jgi:uncharacterized protein with NAD-binding domain and iron-sulfur cluster
MKSAQAEQPIQVAVIGGGCAGMAAAFELTRPEHAGKYRVTVYQQGFRLGGKGASGRGPADRIEEHGLHLWMGFYENAFQLMRECYDELGRDPRHCRIASWRDAFVADNFCGVMDRSPSGAWAPWTVTFPPLPGLPGDAGNAGTHWTVGDYLGRTVTLIRTLLEAVQARPGVNPLEPKQPGPVGVAPTELAAMMARLAKYGGLATLGGLIEGLRVLDEVVRTLPRFPGDSILRFHEALASSAREQIGKLTAGDDELRRLWEVIDLALATVRGIIRFRLVTDPRGFDAIDDYDCREWLMLNGAAESSVNSAFLRALYDLAFAYEDGDITRPRIAAGQAIRGAVRAFFTYRGAFFWKMQAGMGDVVFAPLYEVLVKRGVRFEFFHRLTDVGLPAGRVARTGEPSHVERLSFDVQAEIAGGKPYQPLVDVRGLPCWPSSPDYSQLVDGARLKRDGVAFESHWEARKAKKKTLHVGADFDFVVLAVGVGALPYVCGELVEKDKRWRDMVARVKSVPTQALQLWLSEDSRELGWPHPPINISGYVEPFDTWADMSQLTREERFPRTVRSVAYFCSVLSDASPAELRKQDYPERRNREVRENSLRFIERDLPVLWPKAVDAKGRFRWNLLVGPEAGKSAPNTPARIDTQYYRANVDPSDRYCLSLPGSLAFRLSPLDASYDNLTVAGDWTACGFPEGCVEAAVMSGRLAAHALSRSPALEDIVGFDHP